MQCEIRPSIGSTYFGLCPIPRPFEKTTQQNHNLSRSTMATQVTNTQDIEPTKCGACDGLLLADIPSTTCGGCNVVMHSMHLYRGGDLCGACVYTINNPDPETKPVADHHEPQAKSVKTYMSTVETQDIRRKEKIAKQDKQRQTKHNAFRARCEPQAQAPDANESQAEDDEDGPQCCGCDGLMGGEDRCCEFCGHPLHQACTCLCVDTSQFS